MSMVGVVGAFLFVGFFLPFFGRCGGQITTSVREQPNVLRAWYVQDCCSVVNEHADVKNVDWSRLMRCVNESSHRNTAEVFDNLYAGGGPTLGVALVTYATPDIWEYTAYSLAINEVYAEHNGYIMRHLDPSTSDYDKRDARWNKVKILEEAIHPDTGWARDLTYVVWVDADLVVMDMGLRLEKVAAEFPRAHIILSAEHAGSSTLMNSGAVMVKNSEWSRKFLKEWWDYGDRNLFSDQEQFDLLYKAHVVDWDLERYVSVLPPDALNSDPPAMTQQKPHNQVLHLMGEHTAFRVKVFSSGFRELCRHMAATAIAAVSANFGMRKSKTKGKSKGLANQLTMTRDNLLKWTMDEYSVEAKRLMSEYAIGAEQGVHTLKASRKLSNSVHHFAHALEHRNDPAETVKAKQLRKDSYALLLKNLNNRRPLNDKNKIEQGRVLTEWPELLKIVTEAGQNIVQVGDLAERKRLAKEVLEIMNEMINSCHPDQQRAVLHMFAAFQVEIGLIYLAEDDLERALDAFQLGLQYSRELAMLSGDHILISPLTMVANILCELKRFSEAYGLYAEAIRLAEKTLGPQHESIAQHLLNSGIAFVQSGRFESAEPLLVRAIHLCQINGIPDDDIVPQRSKQFLEFARRREGMVVAVIPPLEPPKGGTRSISKKKKKTKVNSGGLLKFGSEL